MFCSRINLIKSQVLKIKLNKNYTKKWMENFKIYWSINDLSIFRLNYLDRDQLGHQNHF